MDRTIETITRQTREYQHWEIWCRGVLYAIVFNKEAAEAATESLLKTFKNDETGFSRFECNPARGTKLMPPKQPGSMEEMIRSVLHGDD